MSVTSSSGKIMIVCQCPLYAFILLVLTFALCFSQVNPHSALLSSLSLHTSVWSPAVYGAIVSYIKFLLGKLSSVTY